MSHSLPLARVLFIVSALCALPQCSSGSKERKESNGATVSRIDSAMNRGFDRKKKQYDSNFRSEFDQKTFSTNKSVKGKKFRTDGFSGTQPYKGTSDFKAGEFSQAELKSRAGTQTFSQSGKQPSEANKTFGTSDSRFSDQSASQSGKAFAGGDDVFATGAVRDAAKAQKKNVLPKIIKPETQGGQTVYTEQDVKQMLNRN